MPTVELLTPASIGAATAVLVQVLTFLLQKSKIKVDDDSSLRKDLISEREKLTGEIRSLSDRFAKLEQENHDLRMGQIELQKNIGLLEVEKARNLSDLDVLKQRVKDLEQERAGDQAEIARLEANIQEMRDAQQR